MNQYLKLDKSNVAKYEELTYPVFRPRLRKVAPDTSTIAIGVELQSEPIGLVFAAYSDPKSRGTVYRAPTRKTYGEILSLFVAPDYRCQGIGKELLGRMETELKNRGCCEISLKYLDNPHQPVLEKILKQQNWSAPENEALICYATPTPRVNLEKIGDSHLVKYIDKLSSKLSDDYTIFPWHTLTKQEIESIKNQLQTGALDKKFNPFTQEDKIEPLNSLGLRYKDKVIGWMINHRIAPDTIRYTQMYVHPDYQPLSRSILFLAKAIEIHSREVKEVPKATFRVETHNTPMVKFVHRRLAPYIEEIRHAWRASKTVNSQQSTVNS